MFDTRHNAVSLAALASTMMIGGVAAAQAMDAQTEAAPVAQAEQVTVTDADLEAFVEAQEVVAEVVAKYEGRADEAKDDAELAALQEEANVEATEALGKTDMSPERFNQIAMALQNDPALQERYLAVIQ